MVGNARDKSTSGSTVLRRAALLVSQSVCPCVHGGPNLCTAWAYQLRTGGSHRRAAQGFAKGWRRNEDERHARENKVNHFGGVRLSLRLNPHALVHTVDPTYVLPAPTSWRLWMDADVRQRGEHKGACQKKK